MTSPTLKLKSVEYITLDINDLPHNLINSEQKLKEHLLLLSQGDAIELMEYSNPILLYIFETIHFACPEFILRMHSGEKYLIYEHQSEPVIRSSSILNIFQLEEEYMAENGNQKNLIIDSNCFPELSKNYNNEILKRSFEKAKTLIKKCQKVTLIGGLPTPLLLAIYHLLYGNCKQVWYQDLENTKPIRIR